MAQTEVLKTTKSVFDLDTFDEVLLVKTAEFTPAENTKEVLERIGNDSAKMLELLNEGLKAEMVRNLRSVNSGWHTFVADADGEDSNEINGEYTGTPADMTAVNALKLTLAKTVFGYSKSMSKEEKKAAKESAITMIKDTPAIKAGLQKSAAKASNTPATT